MMRSFVFLLTMQSCLLWISYSNSIVTRLPGYSGDLPFRLETGYVGVGEKEHVQLFYYFVESTKNPTEDPLIFYMPGGPGASALVTFFYGIGPLQLNSDVGIDNLTFISSPNAWTQMASIIFVDIPVGTGFSYAETGNERGDQPAINIQGYILISPLTHKFIDFNSRFEYSHRMALISDDIYQSAIDNCNGNYVDINPDNPICSNSLQRYEECTRRINLENILEPFCGEIETLGCEFRSDLTKAINKWANTEVVQQALNIRQGKIGQWEKINQTLHYYQGKNDTSCYSYDIFSSVSDHRKLASKNCRTLIISGDHDLTFPYVGVEQCITSLNLKVEVPWKPFYIVDQVGGYATKFAQNNYSLTFSTVKGAGHKIPNDKPKESMVVFSEWISSQNYLKSVSKY